MTICVKGTAWRLEEKGRESARMGSVAARDLPCVRQNSEEKNKLQYYDKLINQTIHNVALPKLFDNDNPSSLPHAAILAYSGNTRGHTK